MTLWDRLLEIYAVRAYANLSKPIAPDAQLREACECCADESLNVPKEACGVCRG
jgi:hypothetical protein